MNGRIDIHATLDSLLEAVRECRVCAAHLPVGPRPVLQAGPEASILIVGQAPGAKVHASGVPWHDRSGVRSPLYYERHRPEQTTLYRLVQQRAASFIAHTEASTGEELPRFLKDEFDAFLECGILAHGFLRLRCGYCGRDKLLAFSLPSGAGSARHAVRGPDARQLRARGRRAALHRAMSRNGGGALLRYADITPERVDDLSGGARSDTRM